MEPKDILDRLSVAVTCTDSRGIVLYANPAAIGRPTPTSRRVGLDIRDCHGPETKAKLERLFEEFNSGQRKPHHYVSTGTGKREWVQIIPLFEGDVFTGCISQISPLEIQGEERTFS